MKKSLIFFLFLMMFSIISCSSDDNNDDSGNLPDWDYANVVHENENTQQDQNTSDIDNFIKNDEDINDNNQIQPDEDTQQTKPVCGNNKKENGEKCDGMPVDCSQINHDFKPAIANCKSDCSGFDMSACSLQQKKWGIASLDFKTNYILDSAKTKDLNYVKKGLQKYDAFEGRFAQDTIPPQDSNLTGAYAETRQADNLRQTFVLQASFKDGKPVYPYIELEFPKGAITKKDYKINLVSVDIAFIDNWLLKMARIRMIKVVNNQKCVMAMVTSGTVKVLNAWQDNPVEGGKLQLFSNDLEFQTITEIKKSFAKDGDLNNLSQDDLQRLQKLFGYPECSGY